MRRKGFALLLFGYATVAYGGSFDLDRHLRGIRGDPALFMDMNRPAVIDAIVAKWQNEFGDREAATQALRHLRGDQLYSVAVAHTFDAVMAAASGGAAKESGKPAQKFLGDITGDFSYTPIAPCRLVETRHSFPAVYWGDGTPAHNDFPFSPGEVRNYTIQGNTDQCGSQLPSGLNPTAVAITVFGIPFNGGSGDIEIVAQGTQFGSTSTQVFNANTFTTSSTIAQVNQTNHQISLKVRNGGTHVAIDVVGYFKQAVAQPSALLRSTFIGQAQGGNGGVVLTRVDALACPVGKLMVSGGCSTLTAAHPEFLSVSTSDADETNPPSHWVCTFANFDSNNYAVSATTNCIDIPARAQ